MLKPQQPEVSFLSGPFNSISFDLQADWMHTGVGHPPAFTLLWQCLGPSTPRERKQWQSWGRTWTLRLKELQKKRKRGQIKWQQAGQKAVKRELPPVPKALKASELLPTSDIISISIFWVAPLSIEPHTRILWFGSVHAAATGSYPVWSTFWFRHESHRGTLKFTAPTLCPADPEIIMTLGTALPSYITSHPHPPLPSPLLRWHRRNELDPGWVWIIGMQGVVGGVASVMMHLQLSYLSVPGRAFRMQRSSTEKRIPGFVYQKDGVFLGIFIFISQKKTSMHNCALRVLHCNIRFFNFW